VAETPNKIFAKRRTISSQLFS